MRDKGIDEIVATASRALRSMACADSLSRMPSPPSSPPTHTPQIASGSCSVFFACDVGQAIDLDAAERVLKGATVRELLRHRRRNPPWFQYRPPPLRVTITARPIEGLTFRTEPNVDLVLYDFGAVSLEFSIRLAGPLDSLLPLSVELDENVRLEQEARQHIREILDVVGTAVQRPQFGDQTESYAVMVVTRFAEDLPPARVLAEHRALLAGILRAERAPLSAQEIDDALACPVAFGLDDLGLVDWNGALLLDPEPADTLSLLEFANVQLLEMRHLDNTLDDALDRAWAILSRRPSRVRLLGAGDADLQRVAFLQADTAILFESVNNALKLLGDAFLARFYEAAAQRFHLADWHSSVLRKLQVLEGIYGKLADRNASLRMEVLEWIVILLIAISIVLPFLLPVVKG
ncbi:MAG: hypothetical protein IT457_03335 [Planctomycetes bacterium]|nr:hypothetical protein [Planctomycetota bacterium]